MLNQISAPTFKQLSQWLNGQTLRYSFFSVMIFLTGGCTTLQPIDWHQSQTDLSAIIGLNETIVVQTKSHEKFEMVVNKITSTEIIGIDRIIAISDISRIEQNQTHTGRTIGAVAGGIFLTTYVILVAGVFSK